ncbi:Uncharacterized protein BP5553_05413 [Venustampulla echinocandica]|uniref:BZIP domain-containing protein n=1 Tax=Venustampulla echinocandica TaxID=2656787 RepID=A0A370TR28_9HELO|nr:Uncharacterized protein BP5553_05413 [Venustampulla echinocandica]RDL37980.1 Uncharacterized protein BP5553_05413 [Venustampulla echinocandica]
MAYNGRRGPNVSEYIANLNAIPTAQDLQNADNFNLDDELAMFTNTQFFDFDLGQDANVQPANFGIDDPASSVAPDGLDLKPLEFDMQGDFSFPDFNAYAQPPAFSDNNDIAPPAPIQTHQPMYPTSSSAGSPTATVAPSAHAGQKRKATGSMSPTASSTGAVDFEEASRLAAEEDKRRRNTAASARFRVKKKQREQALERSAKGMSDKVAALEGRINQLETENKWLKNLITEKNDSKEDIALLWKKFSQETSERKGAERKDGVGTKA